MRPARVSRIARCCRTTGAVLSEALRSIRPTRREGSGRPSAPTSGAGCSRAGAGSAAPSRPTSCGNRVREHEVDHAANRSIHRHLGPSAPSRMESRRGASRCMRDLEVIADPRPGVRKEPKDGSQPSAGRDRHEDLELGSAFPASILREVSLVDRCCAGDRRLRTTRHPRASAGLSRPSARSNSRRARLRSALVRRGHACQYTKSSSTGAYRGRCVRLHDTGASNGRQEATSSRLSAKVMPSEALAATATRPTPVSNIWSKCGARPILGVPWSRPSSIRLPRSGPLSGPGSRRRSKPRRRPSRRAGRPSRKATTP